MCMIINHNIDITSHATFGTRDTEIQHPNSAHTSTNINGLVVSISAWPKCSDADDSITLCVFVNGIQHVIFNGTTKAAEEFFSKFPKN